MDTQAMDQHLIAALCNCMDLLDPNTYHPETALDAVVRLSATIGQFRSAALFLVDGQQVVLARTIARQGGDEALPGAPYVIFRDHMVRYTLDEDDVSCECARTGEMVMIDSVADSRLNPDVERTQVWEDKIAYFVPLKGRASAKITGVVGLASRSAIKGTMLERIAYLDPLWKSVAVVCEWVIQVRTRSGGQLTDREEQVASLIAKGLTAKEIGTALNISSRTVETYRRRILKKLNLTTTAGIVRYVVDHNIEPRIFGS